jgi:hypothetical protein
MDKKTTVIGIYEIEFDTLAHIVNTIEEAASWIGCGVTTLYDALHRGGVMEARGYYIERVTIEEDLNDGN